MVLGSLNFTKSVICDGLQGKMEIFDPGCVGLVISC